LASVLRYENIILVISYLIVTSVFGVGFYLDKKCKRVRSVNAVDIRSVTNAKKKKKERKRKEKEMLHKAKLL
jgi:phage FluMu protein Com